MKDAASQLRTATRRAKSDVANKLVSMFLHELSRRVVRDWTIKVDSEEYAQLVRQQFDNRCPYCACALSGKDSVIEHLDGMNRSRVGLHIPGNVLVACKPCNSEKRRDDSAQTLVLAESGWASFLSHDGSRCGDSCRSCAYWRTVWPSDIQRRAMLSESAERIASFQQSFPDFQPLSEKLRSVLPSLLGKLYSDCQEFAEREIKSLLQSFELSTVGNNRKDAKNTG